MRSQVNKSLEIGCGITEEERLSLSDDDVETVKRGLVWRKIQVALGSKIQDLDLLQTIFLSLLAFLHHRAIPSETFRQGIPIIAKDSQFGPQIYDNPTEDEERLQSWLQNYKDRFGREGSENVPEIDKSLDAPLGVRDVDILFKDLITAWPSTGVDDLVDLLEKESIICIDKYGFLYIHRHYQTVLADALNKEEKIAILQYLTQVMSASFPNPTPDEDSRRHSEYMLPHIRSVCEHVVDCDVEDNEAYTNMMCMASYLSIVARHDEAKKWLELCIAGRSKSSTVGENHPSTVSAMNNLALVYYDQGDFQEALELHQKVLAIRQSWRPTTEDEGDVEDSMFNIGTTYTALGQLETALEWHKKALESNEKLASRGPEHTRTMSILNSIGIIYQRQSRYEKSLEVLERVYETNKKNLGPNDEDTVMPLSNMAIVYRNQGNLEKCLELNQQVLAAKGKNVGEEHPDTLMILQNMGVAYETQDKFQEALECYVRAYDGFEKTLGSKHPSTLMPLHNMGLVYRKLGRFDEARDCYNRVITASEERYGPDYYDVSSSVNNLGQTYVAENRFNEALPYCLRAYEIRKRSLNDNHTDIASSASNLGFIYCNLDRPEESIPYYSEAAAIYEHHEDWKGAKICFSNVALTYEKQKNWEKALPIKRLALTAQAKADGNEHADTLATHKELGEILEVLKMYDEAIDWYGQAPYSLANSANVKVSQTPEEKADFAIRMGRCNVKLGHIQEGREWYKIALNMRLDALGEAHADTISVMTDIAELYEGPGEEEDSLMWYHRVLAAQKHLHGEVEFENARVMLVISMCYRRLARYDESLVWNMRAIELYRKTAGPDHPQLCMAYNNRGTVYYDMNRKKEALAWYERAQVIKERTLGRDHESTRVTVENIDLIKEELRNEPSGPRM